MAEVRSIGARRIPRQKRGVRRVEALLRAAAYVFADAGYDAATMEAIADRAGAAIGSLYQFFPNKQAVARALRAGWLKEYEHLLDELEKQAPVIAFDELVERYVATLIRFVVEHPAFLPLMDAPSSTRAPGGQERVRRRLTAILLAHRPSMGVENANRAAAIVQHVSRGLVRLYAQSPARDRPWIAAGLKAVLSRYLHPLAG